MEEFMEYAEDFEARQSISSRGSQAKPSKAMNPKSNLKPEQRETTYKPEEREAQYQYNEGMNEYNEGEDAYHGEGESSSVITDIVEEKVVEIESSFEEDKLVEDKKGGEYDQYLDNIK